MSFSWEGARAFVRAGDAPDENHRATKLELFFDLVYVFAFTQVTALMTRSPDAAGVVQALVVLGLLWWTWANASWFANQARADTGLPRVGIVATMATVLLMALVIPTAYRSDAVAVPALVFAAGFFVVSVVITVSFLAAASSDRRLRRQVVRSFLYATMPSTVLLVAGAIVGAGWQLVLWSAAFLFEAVVIYVTAVRGRWQIDAADHFAERHELVVLLALGESIISIGIGAGEARFDAVLALTVVLALALSFTLWFAYFAELSENARHALGSREGQRRGRSAIDGYTYLHFVLVAGTILTAAGIEVAIDHLHDGQWGLYGSATAHAGVALYLGGTSVFARLIVGGWLRLRVGAAVVIVGLIPVTALVTPPIGILIVTAVVAMTLVLERLNSRSRGEVLA